MATTTLQTRRLTQKLFKTRKLPTLVRNLVGIAAAAAALSYVGGQVEAALKTTPATAIELHNYERQGATVSLTMAQHNASGLTYNPDSQTLFAVTNGPTLMIEMTPEGEEIRKIQLKGFDDTEGLVYLGDNRFAIVEEDRRSIALVKIGAMTRWIYREDARLVSLPLTDYRNKGFEGITYDAHSDSLYVVNEKRPMAIYRISGLSNPAANLSISSPWDLEEENLSSTDFAGIHFHPDSGNLVLLSEESRKLTEVQADGTEVSQLSLKTGWFSGLDAIPQPEGITMDDKGTVYILSEPNLLYRFTPSTEG